MEEEQYPEVLEGWVILSLPPSLLLSRARLLTRSDLRTVYFVKNSLRVPYSVQEYSQFLLAFKSCFFSTMDMHL